MKKHAWAICFSAALLLFTTYIALDTFVLRTVYDENATGMNMSMFFTPTDDGAEDTNPASETPAVVETGETTGGTSEPSGTDGEKPSEPEPLLPDSDADSYVCEAFSITLSEYERHSTKIYVADVLLSSAQYFKTAFANDTYGRNVVAKTSTIAEAHNAVLAINGDYYGAQEKGYVIRNGIVYRASAKGSDLLCILANGTMKIVNDREYTAEELVETGVWQAFSFGPALIGDGRVTVGVNDEVGKAKASNPRTAVGLIDANHFVFVVSDGRTSESEGLSLYELAEFMKELGVTTAYNLDGGGSSTMVFCGEIVNNPTTNGRIREREVSDVVYVGI